MNDTPSTQPPPSSPDLVQVVLSDCSAADADAVFGALCTHFRGDRGDDAPRQTEATRPAVWTGSFQASRAPGPVPGVLLSGSVTADLQGGPAAVDRLRAVLEGAFSAAAEGTVSGDQEVQVQLRLTGADRGAPPAGA
ncbi:hypothetical protein C9F11_41130 [Streptomyces sp. YIM 121038]|uniref:hypothetical protein n=1 Tax=Streptomyces sp. YIM 121038 TaxID=2136401 RepID=UPI001110EAB2|nr:hypothetical protein [Streptomyces sp. YIM 121038]QCX81806.1 hypothetical protein C9F11_41130 [Streptomyces sp. YIM 121038]